jgi:hypothetical protein
VDPKRIKIESGTVPALKINPGRDLNK